MRDRARIALIFVGIVAFAQPVSAQTTCGEAQQQLQNYIAQVNEKANVEYFQAIPARCGTNFQCGNWWIGQLNAWYANEGARVNYWYTQLSVLCTTNPIRPRPIPRGNPAEGIDDDAVEDLEVDDEDKTVVLRIPDNPRGFRRRN